MQFVGLYRSGHGSSSDYSVVNFLFLDCIIWNTNTFLSSVQKSLDHHLLQTKPVFSTENSFHSFFPHVHFSRILHWHQLSNSMLVGFRLWIMYGTLTQSKFSIDGQNIKGEITAPFRLHIIFNGTLKLVWYNPTSFITLNHCSILLSL